MNWFKSIREALTRERAQFDDALNFTPRAQQVLRLAREEADRLHHHFVGTEHLLLGLLRLGQGTGFNVLGKMGVDLERVRREVEKLVGPGPEGKGSGWIPYTPRVKKALAIAAKEAKALHHTYVGTEHVLLGLLGEGDGVAACVLKDLTVDTEVTRQHILRELDPNYASAITEESADATIDISKRYDVYCLEGNQEVVYRNMLFKGTRTLLIFPEYVELEQADGRTIFIARSAVTKFCEHGITPGSEQVSS